MYTVLFFDHIKYSIYNRLTYVVYKANVRLNDFSLTSHDVNKKCVGLSWLKEEQLLLFISRPRVIIVLKNALDFKVVGHEVII